MNIFLSWSGEISQTVARKLREWLPSVLTIEEPWMSSEDLEPGKRWEKELASVLAKVEATILVISKSNVEASWLLFEAGASAKTVDDKACVIPYLVGLEPSAITQSPLAIFQAVKADKMGTWKMIQSLNNALENQRISPEDRLRERFDTFWPQLEKTLKNLPTERARISIRETKKVAFVINSTESFNKQIIRGFSQEIQELERQHTKVLIKEYLHTDASSFILAMNRVEFDYPDHIVIVPPSREIVNFENDVGNVLNRLSRNNVNVIFIENAPDNFESFKGLVSVIVSDSEAGAQILSRYAISILDERCKVLLLNGPQDSENAAVRRAVFLKELHGFNVVARDLTSWSQSETESYVERHISESNNSFIPDLIICGNDAMAIGAVRGVRRILKESNKMPKIFGYDGLFRALVAISDDANPFCATISIPPSSYGKYAAMSIIQKMIRKRSDNKEGLKRIIPINKENLITIEKANDYLDSEPWAQ